MKILMKSFVFCLLSFVLVLPSLAQSLPNRRSAFGRTQPPGRSAASATSTAAATDDEGEGSRSIEFNATPIDLVFEVYQNLVGKTVLKDPQTPAATITLKPKKGQELSDEDKIEAIETVLEMNGIHMEPYGEKFMRALPRKDARKDGIPLLMDPEAKLGESTRVVSLMIPFKNIAIDEAQKALEGFKSNSGILLVFERTNSILVTDTEQIINRMREIAKAIDIASPVTEVVEYIQIKYANANEVKQVIDSIVQESMKDQEKNGKQPKNSSQPAVTPSTQFGSRLLKPNQPATPANNISLVTTVSDADRGMIRGKVVTIADERSNKILIITNASNMKFFKEVIAALDVETTPDVQVKVYRLKYAEAEDVSDMINDLIGNSASSKGAGKGNQNQNSAQGTSGNATRGTTTVARKPANQRSGDSKAGELNKDNVTVLADKRINGLVVMARTEDIPTIEQIIESMDIKLSQVLIETMIIEVTLGDDIATGMDWVQKGRQETTTDLKNPMGQTMYYRQRTYTTSDSSTGSEKSWTQVFGDMVPQGYSSSGTTVDSASGTTTTWADSASEFAAKTSQIATDGVLNYYTAGTATAIAGGKGGELAYSIAKGVTSNIFGKALNFVFTSDELGLTAILQATKIDSHSKYIASPIVMTLDNKEAIIEATTKQQFLTGWQAVSSSYAGSGLPSPTYTSEDIGIKIKATPKINPNGTVMLTVEEEYSQVAGTQTMLTPRGSTYEERSVDVPSTRKMSSDVILENNQTVVFGGLTQKYTSEREQGIPILKDIPYIGKWLFGTVEQKEARTELLVFMTPYVLDDAQAAQVEAIRRKKTMSDVRAWEDNGWSLSEVADPVAKKEQMRRLKEEWKKQDEERRTRHDIEKLKIKRAKELESMSKEERDEWLKLHKAELEKEEQEKLEEQMRDEKSQEELKKLAAEIREKKLGSAEKDIDAAEKDVAQLNERAKLDAEKKAEEEEKAASEAKKVEEKK